MKDGGINSLIITIYVYHDTCTVDSAIIKIQKVSFKLYIH